MVDVSIVVPVYNSEGCLEELHRQVAAALSGRSFELILVDDRSADGSWGVIRRLGAADARVVGLRHRKNAGQDNALLTGLRRARRLYSDYGRRPPARASRHPAPGRALRVP
jgi:glycosyltransferase involved in cell wall biosynthesis